MKPWLVMIALGWMSLSLAYAGDAAGLSVWGFSQDGRYLAFEQFGVEDGSGLPYAEYYFIDVPNNAYATSPISADPKAFADKGLEAAINDAKTRAKPWFDKLHLQSPQAGIRVIHHPLTDLGADAYNVAFSSQTPLAGVDVDQYELTLNERNTEQTCAGVAPAKILSLTLKNQHSGRSVTLQNDARLPTSRGCVIRYRIQDVYTYEDHVAVFINLFSPGFEGENMRFMVITGKLPKD